MEILIFILFFIVIQSVFWMMFSISDVDTLSDAKSKLNNFGIVTYLTLTFSMFILYYICEYISKIMKKILFK